MLVRGGRVLIWNQRNRIIFDWMSDDSLYETGRTSGETPGLQWMPDGQHLLIWSKKMAQVLSEDGHVVYSETFPENGGPQCYENERDVVPDTAAVSSTSGAVAFGCSDARIRIWKPATGEWIESEPMPYKTDYLARFVSLAWSPDGSRLVSGFSTHSHHIMRIWNADGTSGTDFDVPSPAGLCWSPNGRYVVTGSGELLNADGPAGSARKLPLLDASPTLGRVAWKAYWSSGNRIDFVSAAQPIMLGRGQLRSFTPTGRQLPSAPQCNPLLVADSAWISEDGPTLVKYAVESSDAANDYVTRFQTFSADGTIGARFDLPSGYLGSRGGLSWIAPRGGRTWVSVGREILIHDAHGKQTGSVQYDALEQPVVSWLNGWNSTGSQFALLVLGDDRSFVDVIAPDGTRRQPLELGRNADYYSHFFEWSPSGTSLAITARLKDGSGLTTIWRTDDSTKPAAEFPTATYVPPFGLAWSPDSKWLAVFGSSGPENPTGSLTLFHLPSLHVFEPAALNSFSAVPFWQDGTHVQNDNRLIEVSTESDNGIAEIAKLPFEVQPYEGFVVRGFGPGRSVDYRSPNAGQGASGLDVWTSQNRVATIPFLSREFVPAPVRKSQPTHDGLCLLCFNLAPLVGVIDLKQQAMRFVAMAYDDSTAISLSPAGRIIDGPDDVDPYLMYMVQYPGGAEVALTRREFHDRIGLDESQQALNWVLDIGGAIRLSDTEKWLTRRDLPVSEALPASIRVVDVDLSSCAFDEKESLSRLATIPSLTEVRLSNSTVAHVSGLAGCKTIRSLDLSDTGIESIEKLSHLSEIQSLNLSGTRVRSAIGPTLAAFPELEELDLSKTAVDEFVLSDLAHLKRLRKLDLTGLKIPEDAIDRLRAGLPSCTITTGTAVPAGNGSKAGENDGATTRRIAR